MREYITSYDDIPGFAGHIWSALHQEMREKPDVALLVEVTPDRRRTMHYGGTYFGSETSISMSGAKKLTAWSKPGILIATNCFDKINHQDGFTHTEYPQIAENSLVGNVSGWQRMIRAAVCHEVAHALTDYHTEDTLVKHFPAIDAKPFRGHSGTWLAVYAWLRERFVNGGLDKP